jgi:hypothetical protein
MAQDTTVGTASDVLLAYLLPSTEASGVPATVQDESTLLALARVLNER